MRTTSAKRKRKTGSSKLAISGLSASRNFGIVNQPAGLTLLTDPLAPRHLPLRDADRADKYMLFLSSSDEVAAQRRRVRGLINEAFNPQLERTSSAYIALIQWEDVVPQRAPDEDVNAIFVERAVESHMTLVLLQDHFGDGTKEELEAVIDKPDVQLSVIRFAPDPGQSRAVPDRIAEFLAPHRRKLLYDETGEQQSDAALHSIVRALFAMALSAYEKSRPIQVHSELR